MLTEQQAAEIEQVLSKPRLGRFLIPPNYNTKARALELYRWNAEVSAAFMLPLHFCEVALRNAIIQAIEATYGADWWKSKGGFERSLPMSSYGYNPKNDLRRARSRYTTAGKIIPGLKFVFWAQMLTQRHDHRIWNKHLRTCFPNLPATLTIFQCREDLYNKVDAIRMLRNRIAHHEPIFDRALKDDLNSITTIVSYRSIETINWLRDLEPVTMLLQSKP